jgi:phosphohistidine phosphatase
MAMDLFLIRHGEAASLGPDVPADDARPLTDKGWQQCAAVAAALQRGGVTLDRLITSPLLRARQTAEGILEHWNGPKPELLVSGALQPDTKSKKLKRFLLTLEGSTIGLVGHQPDLGKLAAWLIGGKKAELGLAKAGFAKIHFEETVGKGSGVLTLLIPPDWFCG